MASNLSSPERKFAIDVVRRLREAGFESLWAGGCVRDELLGIRPKDFDVATSATPQQVIELFGKRKTVPVGAAFGVIMVLGPNPACGQIEVATFRSDGDYLDGRRPSEVKFCSAQEDARRRDFTINGIFFDPIAKEVIDYVDGRQDLTTGIVRAIGDPVARFTEDKLRMLRAVRFAATFDFQLEQKTASAVRELGRDISQVSVERIAQELRRMMAHPSRSVAVRQLVDVSLFGEVFPSPTPGSADLPPLFGQLLQKLSRLRENSFEPALSSVLFFRYCDPVADVTSNIAAIRRQCRCLRLSNEETQCICWLIESAEACQNSRTRPFHVTKPILNDKRIDLLLDFLQADESRQEDAQYLQDFRNNSSSDSLNPGPFIDGRDLKELGVEPGPEFKRILTLVRNEQLDEVICDRDQAMQRVKQIIYLT